MTADSTSKTYGDGMDFNGDEFATSSLVEGDSVDWVHLTSDGAAPTSPVAGSPYDIVADDAFGSGLVNYDITYVDGKLTVKQAELMITAGSTTKIYGQTVNFTGTEFSTDGLFQGDGVSSVTLASDGAAATAQVGGSPYAIAASNAQGNGLGNYHISYTDGSLAVDQKLLTITAESTSKAYGQAVIFAGTEFSTDGLVNGDSAGLVSLASDGAGATAQVDGSPYDIVASAATGARMANYDIMYVDGQLTIGQATLTITADDASKTYGTWVNFAENGFTSTGLINGDTVDRVHMISDGQPEYAQVSGSPYHIEVVDLAGSGLRNYIISYVDGLLTVNKADLTIKANDASKIYGQEANFDESGFSTDGLVNGDDVFSVALNSAGAAATAKVVGSPYAIVASAADGFGLDNYNISYAGGELTVSKADLMITAASTTKTYGQTVTFAGTEFATSSLVEGDSVSGVTLVSDGAAATAQVGNSPYAIGASAAVGSGLENYNISFTTGSLNINKAVLNVRANDASKTYGDAVIFAGTEFTASGLVNSDHVTRVALSSIGAAASVHVGTKPYVIVADAAEGAGLDNYDIRYGGGELIVNKARLIITANNTTMILGGPVPTLSAYYTGFVNGDNRSNLGSLNTLTLTPGNTSVVGNTAITTNGGVTSSDYTIVYDPGTLTVTPFKPIVIGLPPSKKK
ncbi:MBG domain-containing protein [Paludisphaera mucosa]|uniref:MBG domain-containing protein n=1 Tax=Paludisphaera mucosa TaxID=3030827 RepID=A0ABT6FA71_9BACT|nr:MBG domain-containing protein [Paludisphaera mucosa]